MSFKSLFPVSAGKPAYVIAEIGTNFLSYEEGARLIDAAKEAGVDCVKIQTFRAKTLVNKKAIFDMDNTGKISQYDYFKRYELSKAMHKKIFDYAGKKGLDCFSTPSHKTDVDMLESLGVKAYKIGADDAVNTPFLRYIAKKKLPIFLSTGMCTLGEIKESVSVILKEGNDKIVIFHTISAYPTYPKFVNLNVISTLRKEFPEFPIGFSDHTMSPLASIAAAVLGAKVIERHFTLDKKAKGPDHILSSAPYEMKYIIDNIREVEKMMGSGIKAPVGPEIKNRLNNRKSITASGDIRKNEVFSENNITIKRPGTGVSPNYYEQILGKKALRNIKEDDVIARKDIDWKK